MICHGTLSRPRVLISEEELAMKLKQVFVAAMLLAPTAALAAPGIVTASVGMRAGPGPGFPMVDRTPGGAHVNIHGCLRGDAWCDVSWSGDRGWVSSQYLEYLYRNRYVYLPDYVDVIDVPVVPFVLSSYWSSHYSGRPWYHRHAYWRGYWQSHARLATQMPTDRSTRLGRTETRTAVTEGRTRTGVAPGRARQQSLANVRSAQAAQGRMAHVNGANRTFSRTQQPMARGHEATRFSAAPAARRAMPAHIAQPNVGRVGGSPVNARAQMGAPRAAPAMPHVGGGGPPHINAAPRVGGSPAAAGPPGHQRH
jgi:uncharacterized protein YraI